MDPNDTNQPPKQNDAPQPGAQITPSGQAPAANPVPAQPQSPDKPVAPAAPSAAAPVTPVSPAILGAPVTSSPVVSSDGPVAAGAPAAAGGLGNWFGKHKKLLAISGASLGTLLVAGLAFYFGYWTRPNVVYSQGLSNFGKGVEELTAYASEETEKKYPGYTGSGNYKFVMDGQNVTGNVAYKANDTNAELSLDADFGIKKVDFMFRGLNLDKTTPGVYFKAGNITGLGALTGSPELGAIVDGLDDKWIVVDQELIAMLEEQATEDEAAQPSEVQVLSAVQAFNRVNREYVFTGNAEKAVLDVKRVVGKEEVDGHSTYRYEVALNKANAKKYLDAQKAALKASELNKWIEANDYQKRVDEIFTELQKSVDEAESDYTFDIWCDINRRVLYKVRFADPENKSDNYVEFGLDYKGGNDYPIFVAVRDATDADAILNANFRVTVSTEDDTVVVKAVVKQSGEGGADFNLDFTAKPSEQEVTIDKPANAVPLTQVLESFGLGGLLGGTQAGVQSRAQDTKRQTDLSTIQASLEEYYANNVGNYPTLTNLNSASWRARNMPNLDAEALKDPNGSSSTLAAAPGAGTYAYSPVCAGNACSSYTLTATLSTGERFTRSSLN